MNDKSEVLSRSQVQFITLVFKCTNLCRSHGKLLHEFGGEKPISGAKPAHFDIL
jgi:hypothetical protein